MERLKIIILVISAFLVLVGITLASVFIATYIKSSSPSSSIGSWGSDEDFRVLAERNQTTRSDQKIIQLKNGLKVMLVSDSLASGRQKSAASMAVPVGAFHDPPDLSGLAHLLEHLVFMGTEEFPEENFFTDFLSKNGGIRNAETHIDKTLFYFEVSSGFREGLNKFAQMFINPLLKLDTMQRERQNVDSEYHRAIPNDGNKMVMIRSTMMKEGHPLGHFISGSSKSLSLCGQCDEEVNKRLRGFFDRHYSANSMALVVQSHDPIEELEAMVADSFMAIHSSRGPRETLHAPGTPYDLNKFNRLYKMVPTNDKKTVSLYWCLPPIKGIMKNVPNSYLAILLLNQGRGSLMAYLKKKSWATGVTVQPRLTELSDEVQIDVELTDTGFEHKDEVIEAVFAYLAMLKNSSPSMWIREEFEKIHSLMLQYYDAEPIEDVNELSTQLLYHPPQWILSDGNVTQELDQDLIQNYIKSLRVSNVNIILSSKTYQEEATNMEPWFKSQYSDEPFTLDQIQMWENPSDVEDFHLPLPNMYLPDDTTVPMKNIYSHGQYKRIRTDSRGELFFQQDLGLDKPIGIVDLKIYLPWVKEHISRLYNSVTIDLYVACLRDLLYHDIYSAAMGLIQVSTFTVEEDVVNLKIEGLSEKIPLLIDTVVGKFKRFEITEEFFAAKKDEVKRGYHNSIINSELLAGNVKDYLLRGNWLFTMKQAVIGRINLQDLTRAINEILGDDDTFVEANVYGNFDKETAIQIYESLASLLDKTLTLPYEKISYPSSVIPTGSSYARIKAFNLQDTNTIIVNHYQYGEGNFSELVLMEIVQRFVADPLFYQLRSKESLGYVVESTIENIGDMYGITIVINSKATLFTPDHIGQRIEAFLTWFLDDHLANLTDEAFEIVISGLINEKATTYSSGQHHHTLNDYIFSLDHSPKEEVVEMAKMIFSNASRRMLSVQVVGNPDGIRDDINNDNIASIDPSSVFVPRLVQPDGNTGGFIQDLEEFWNELQWISKKYEYIDDTLARLLDRIMSSSNRTFMTPLISVSS